MGVGNSTLLIVVTSTAIASVYIVLVGILSVEN